MTEAPITQEIFNTYADSGLAVIGVGTDWGQPYTCDTWASEFELTYPILDDSDGDLWNLTGATAIPVNVLINHEMELVYAIQGWDETSFMEALTSALEECGTLCQSPCSGVLGDIDGTADEDDVPIVNVMDLLRFADIIESGDGLNDCIVITGEFTNDGIIDIIDIYAFANMLLEGAFNN